LRKKLVLNKALHTSNAKKETERKEIMKRYRGKEFSSACPPPPGQTRGKREGSLSEVARAGIVAQADERFLLSSARQVIVSSLRS